jgi:hypothetical protein
VKGKRRERERERQREGGGERETERGRCRFVQTQLKGPSRPLVSNNCLHSISLPFRPLAIETKPAQRPSKIIPKDW